jgi:hypothetical protein
VLPEREGKLQEEVYQASSQELAIIARIIADWG